MGTSIEGKPYEQFFENGTGARYLKSRNKNGCGHSCEEFTGHSYYLSDIKDIQIGSNGKYGYRRNTPHLRKYPSDFGVFTRSSLYA